MSDSRNEYNPDRVSPPGDTLKEALGERSMAQVDLAQRIGMSRKHVKQMLDGAAPITPETALKLERVLKIPAQFWNNREQQYRDFLAREAEKGQLMDWTAWLSNFKRLRNMRAHGWLPEGRDKIEVLRSLLNFFGVASPDAWQEHWASMAVRYRRSQTYEPDWFALAAWLRRGELKAQEIDCSPYDEAAFRLALWDIRKLTVDPPEVFQPALMDLCATCGVAVAFVPELPKTVSGATRWLTSSKALIQLSLKYKRDDHLWFTFFHEAGHVLLHSKKDIFLETKAADSEEEEANRFAARTLIPPTAFQDFVANHPTFSDAAIRRFARDQGIAPGIVVGQLQHAKKLPFSRCNDLKVKLEWRVEGD